MRLRRLSSSVSLCVALAVVLPVAAGQITQIKSSKIEIKNFGCVNEKYFRGAQPTGRDYASLAALGIRTVIDLQRDGAADEKETVEANGMQFFRLGMNTTDRPDPEKVSQFLRIVNEPTNQPVFVHCKGGRHRTGVMTAIYRLTHDRWTAERAFVEMKQYEFDRGFGHGALKDYVYIYFAGLDRGPANNSESIKASAASSSRN